MRSIQYLSINETEHSIKIKRIINSLQDAWGPNILMRHVFQEAKQANIKKKDVHLMLNQLKIQNKLHQPRKDVLWVIGTK